MITGLRETLCKVPSSIVDASKLLLSAPVFFEKKLTRELIGEKFEKKFRKNEEKLQKKFANIFPKPQDSRKVADVKNMEKIKQIRMAICENHLRITNDAQNELQMQKEEEGERLKNAFPRHATSPWWLDERLAEFEKKKRVEKQERIRKEIVTTIAKMKLEKKYAEEFADYFAEQQKFYETFVEKKLPKLVEKLQRKKYKEITVTQPYFFPRKHSGQLSTKKKVRTTSWGWRFKLMKEQSIRVIKTLEIRMIEGLLMNGQLGLRKIFADKPFKYSGAQRKLVYLADGGSIGETPIPSQYVIPLRYRWKLHKAELKKAKKHLNEKADDGFFPKVVEKAFLLPLIYLKNYSMRVVTTSTTLIGSTFGTVYFANQAVTQPLYIPFECFAYHTLCLLTYDKFSQEGFSLPSKVAAPFGHSICAAFLAVWGSMVPIAGGLAYGVAFGYSTFSQITDNLFYHTLIKRLGRVPARDDVFSLCTRIFGPDLVYVSDEPHPLIPSGAQPAPIIDTSFLIHAIEIQLAMQHINAWKVNASKKYEKTSSEIDSIQKEFNQLFSVNSPFRIYVDTRHPRYVALEEQIREAKSKADSTVASQLDYLAKLLVNVPTDRLTFTESQWDCFVKKVKPVVMSFVKDNIISQYDREDEFWLSVNLAKNEWEKYIQQQLRKTFGNINIESDIHLRGLALTQATAEKASGLNKMNDASILTTGLFPFATTSFFTRELLEPLLESQYCVKQ